MSADRGNVAKDRPGVIAPPPLLFAAAFLGGWFGRGLLPIRAFLVPAVVLAGLSGTLAGWAFLVMARAKTNVDPYQPTTALVCVGPFAFTRNPLYLAMTLGFVSASLWTGWLFALCLLPLVLAVLYLGVIRREERYLQAKFGEEYRAYRLRVRRWM